jgi:hypothetical protein
MLQLLLCASCQFFFAFNREKAGKIQQEFMTQFSLAFSMRHTETFPSHFFPHPAVASPKTPTDVLRYESVF